MASTQLQRTSGTSTENYKYTFSAWVKRTGVLGSSSVNEVLFSSWDGSSNSAYIRFEDQNDNLQVYDKYGSVIDLNYQTDMKFRDSNAWYHIVVDVDGTRSANQRCKIYVNGSQVSCSNTTDSGGTLAMKTVTATNATRLGAIRTSGGAEYYFNGLMSHVHYIDGTGYDASYFGETDSTTGEWKIKTDVTGVTYGNNGFFVLKDGNSVTDQSGNSNNFAVGGGTLTKTEDNPSNVFATLNPLDNYFAASTFSNGNNTITSGTTPNTWNTATLGVSSGKWYWETELDAESSGGSALFGIADRPTDSATRELGDLATTYAYLSSGNFRTNNSNTSNGVSATVGDIIGIALDLDNNQISYYKNGTIIGSAQSITAPSSTLNGVYFPAWGDWLDPGTVTFKCNFGNGYFGTTAVSSAGTNASGNGIFEYDVPTGYTALSTKGLNL